MKTGKTIKLKDNPRLREYSPTQELLDETFITKAIWECLKNNDRDGAVEVIETYLEVFNKMSPLSKAILETASDMAEIGILSKEEHDKITMRHEKKKLK